MGITKRNFQFASRLLYLLGISSMLAGILLSLVHLPGRAASVSKEPPGQCGSGYVYKDETPPDFVYDGPQIITHLFVKAASPNQGEYCFEFTADGNNGCYTVSGLGTHHVTVINDDRGEKKCYGISHVAFHAGELPPTEPECTSTETETPTETVTATETQTETTTPTETETPTETVTPTDSETPTETITPTTDIPPGTTTPPETSTPTTQTPPTTIAPTTQTPPTTIAPTTQTPPTTTATTTETPPQETQTVTTTPPVETTAPPTEVKTTVTPVITTEATTPPPGPELTTVAPPVSQGTQPSVLVPVTGADHLGGGLTLDLYARLLFNIGLGSIGLAFVIQGIRSKQG